VISDKKIDTGRATLFIAVLVVALLNDAIPVKFQPATPEVAAATEGGFQIGE